MNSESVTLYFTQGSSDKIYQAELKPWLGGWTVNFAYGRRNKPMKAGTKTPDPVDYDIAKKAYDKLVASKVKKGYTPDTSGAAYSMTEHEDQVTGFEPQLLTAVEKSELFRLFTEWSRPSLSSAFLQTKHDGERRGIIIDDDGNVLAAKRNGLATSINGNIENDLKVLKDRLNHSVTLDCEDMGEHLVIFDVLEVADRDIRPEPFKKRAALLPVIQRHLLGAGDLSKYLSTLKVDIPTAPASLEELDDYVSTCQINGEEGIVMRSGNAIYTPGRSKECVKFKFVETATCLVWDVHLTKASITLAMLDAQLNWVTVGNCTIPANYNKPNPGDFVEIQYLYAYPGGSLYQPVYKGTRNDVTKADTLLTQLKYKS